MPRFWQPEHTCSKKANIVPSDLHSKYPYNETSHNTWKFFCFSFSSYGIADFCHSFHPPETEADICIEQNNGFLFITQRCSVCAWMGTYCSAPLKACGAGSLLILGMLLPGEQSKWGLSEIKCHRSEGLSLWNLLQTDLFVVVTLSDASWRHTHASSPHARSQVLCVAPVYFLFQWEQNRLSEWLFTPLTYLECC